MPEKGRSFSSLSAAAGSGKDVPILAMFESDNSEALKLHPITVPEASWSHCASMSEGPNRASLIVVKVKSLAEKRV